MKKSDVLSKLLSDFSDSVIAQDLCVERHDLSGGNAFAKKYIAAARGLLRFGPEGIDAFASLLQHERIEVRTTAASYLLPFRTNEALNVLEQSKEA